MAVTMAGYVCGLWDCPACELAVLQTPGHTCSTCADMGWGRGRHSFQHAQAEKLGSSLGAGWKHYNEAASEAAGSIQKQPPLHWSGSLLTT